MPRRAIRRHPLRFHSSCLALLLFASAAPAHTGAAAETVRWTVDQAIDVEPAWSGHRVGFSLLTAGAMQYVAYYDAERRMSIASRRLDEDEWTFMRLPSDLGWDSHNFVTLALDRTGNLHVSGNMHCIPLIYFRTSEPGNIETLNRIPTMVGENEQRCTYPRFLYDAEDRLLFTYRDGSSGNGNQIWNIYDADSKTWKRLLDAPLTDGEGLMNAYFRGPMQGPDGRFHLCWVWRDTPDCATNHDLSYARSADMVHWETSDGTPLTLPIRLADAEIVDPVPVGGGMINSNIAMGFDAHGRVGLSYHKFDADGNTQIYNARREADGWKIYQASEWADYRWEFSGGGTVVSQVSVSAVSVDADGVLRQSFGNPNGGGHWRLDPATLRATTRLPRLETLPPEVGQLLSTADNMQVRMSEDLADSYGRNAAGGRPMQAPRELERVKYIARWESRPANRDRPWPGPVPSPSTLRVYRLTVQE